MSEIREGTVKKGGQNVFPKTSRPESPSGQRLTKETNPMTDTRTRVEARKTKARAMLVVQVQCVTETLARMTAIDADLVSSEGAVIRIRDEIEVALGDMVNRLNRESTLSSFAL